MIRNLDWGGTGTAKPKYDTVKLLCQAPRAGGDSHPRNSVKLAWGLFRVSKRCNRGFVNRRANTRGRAGVYCVKAVSKRCNSGFVNELRENPRGLYQNRATRVLLMNSKAVSKRCNAGSVNELGGNGGVDCVKRFSVAKCKVLYRKNVTRKALIKFDPVW